MTNKDEIRIVAQEVAERYFGLMKEYLEKEIQLHTAKCTAGKFSKLSSFLSATFGGCIVALVNWALRHRN